MPSNKRSKGGFKSARGFGNEVALASFLVLDPIIREMKRRHHSKLLKIVEVIARHDEGAVVGCQSGLRPRDTPLRHTQVYHPLCLAIPVNLP